jgi:hypothetical protein
MSSLATVRKLQARIKRLEGWIAQEGEQRDVCTYWILNKRICSNCRCQRQPNQPRK